MRLFAGLALASTFALGGCAAPSQEARFTRAVLSQEVGNLDAARDEYLRIVQTGEATAAVYNNLAVITARQKKLDEARNWLEYAVATDPDDVIARANLGVVEFHLGARDRAGEALVEARQRREEILRRLPAEGRVSWYATRYAEYTEHADQVARDYLARLEKSAQAPALPDGSAQLAWLIAE